MKKIVNMFSLFTILAVQAFASEQNCLNEACGYVVLSSEHIKDLDSWNDSKEICLGVDHKRAASEEFAVAKNSGLILEDSIDFFKNESTKHLAGISFDSSDEVFSNEIFSSKELIAEHSVLHRCRVKVIEVSEEAIHPLIEMRASKSK